jgi:thioredoxin reductase (NADPH)
MPEDDCMIDIIVVGGGCAGLTAALYASRAGKSVLLFESENIGGQITAAPRVDNYPGIPHISGMQFADSLYEQVTESGVTIELDSVQSIQETGSSKTVITENGSYKCRAIILATGSRHRKLGLPREAELTGHGVSYCAVCDGAFYKECPVAVVGGGNTAIGDAVFLSFCCESVTVIHRRSEFRADASLMIKAQARKNIRWVTEVVPQELLGDKNLTGIRVLNPGTGEIREILIDAVFVAIGQIPENDAFAEIVDTDSSGYLIAGEDCATNVPGIYAAGDCRTKSVRQLTTAAADGAIAAIAAWEYISDF